MMSAELQHAASVELSDFFCLAAPPLIVQTHDVAGDDGIAETATGRRAGGGRRAHRHRAGTTTPDRPAGSGARRNERERNRVRQVNAGFDRLRDHVPQGRRNRKLSKVDTLRAAVEYIGHLQTVLCHADIDVQPTVDVTDENFVSESTVGSWYLDARFCSDLDRVSTESSMTQLLVSPEDIARALTGGNVSASCSGIDHRLTVDVGGISSPTADGLSFTGSACCGGCSTPESVDPELTSSSAGDPLDDDAEQLLNLATWLT